MMISNLTAVVDPQWYLEINLLVRSPYVLHEGSLSSDSP